MAGLDLLATLQAFPSQDIIDNALISEVVVPYVFNGRNPTEGAAVVATDCPANPARVVSLYHYHYYAIKQIMRSISAMAKML